MNPGTRQTAVSVGRTTFAVVVSLCLGIGIATAQIDDARPSSLQEARRLFLTGKYDEAAERYSAHREALPVAAGIGLARCRAAQGRRDEAEKALAEAAAADENSVPVLAERALLHWQLGSHGEARTLVDRALELEPNCVLARWVESQLLKARGDLEGASRVYRLLLDLYNQADEFSSPDDLRWIALAAADHARWNRLPEQFKLLVGELLPAALRIDPDYWPAHLEMGRLFLEKHNQAEAARALAAAHRINSASPDVLATQARLALEQFDIDQARRLVARAKGIHPRHLESLLVEADVAIALFDPRRAVEVLEEARTVNPRHEPTLGRLAAALALRDGELDARKNPAVARIIEASTEYNPQAGEFYAAVADALDQCRQYPAARDYLQKAIEATPGLVGPRSQLGLIHMRLGDEAAARELLEQAFEDDPFDVRARNTLEVLDVLDTYETLETEHFIIRYDPRHDRVLARCAADYLESVYPELTERLGFAPPEKTLFEFFHDAKNTKGHGWFSARMVGLPQIHTIGACAGKMVALTSPTSMPNQRFHWARVLRHEFVHVINLQQTDFHVPHWFTEALAVRLEDLPRPAEWDELLARRASQGQLFDLRDINLGFIRPQSSDDWTLAYCQAELYADHLVDRFGEGILADMLEAYRDGLDTAAAIERCCGVSVREVEQSYTGFLRSLTSDLVASGAGKDERTFVELRLAHQTDPEDLDTAAELAKVHLARKQYPQARALAEAVRQSQPRHQLAGYVLARLHVLTGERDQAVKLLSMCLHEDESDAEDAATQQDPQPDALKLLASLRLQAGQTAGAVLLLERGARHQPSDLTWTKTLAAIALKSGDNERLRGYLERLAAADGDDLPIRKKLAILAAERKDFPEAARWATDAVHIDVLDAEMHKLRAASLAKLGRHREAADAFRLATVLRPGEAELWSAYLAACRQAGLSERAAEVAQAWLENHPQDAAAQAAVEELVP
jgi:cellulose synthase operon protein C